MSISADELLAIARIRQYKHDRQVLSSPPPRAYRRRGWADRCKSSEEARLIRKVDFERALRLLPDDVVMLLLLYYGDGETTERTSRVLGWSIRKLSYMLPEARRALAGALDHLNLL
jgi:DNA-directed RNA polymerase specialized sigma24 family protein